MAMNPIMLYDLGTFHTVDAKSVLNDAFKPNREVILAHDFNYFYVVVDERDVRMLDLATCEHWKSINTVASAYFRFFNSVGLAIAKNDPMLVSLHDLKADRLLSRRFKFDLRTRRLVPLPDGKVGFLQENGFSIYNFDTVEEVDRIHLFSPVGIGESAVKNCNFIFSYPLFVLIRTNIVERRSSNEFLVAVYNIETGTRFLYDLTITDRVKKVEWAFLFIIYQNQFFMLRTPVKKSDNYDYLSSLPIVVYRAEVTGESNVWVYNDSDFLAQHDVYDNVDDIYDDGHPLPVVVAAMRSFNLRSDSLKSFLEAVPIYQLLTWLPHSLANFSTQALMFSTVGLKKDSDGNLRLVSPLALLPPIHLMYVRWTSME